jgi:hypothetical protein
MIRVLHPTDQWEKEEGTTSRKKKLAVRIHVKKIRNSSKLRRSMIKTEGNRAQSKLTCGKNSAGDTDDRDDSGMIH